MYNVRLYSQSADCADVLAYLLEEGAPVSGLMEGTSMDVATPLHYAVAAGHMTCIQVLLEHNADVNAMAISEQVRTHTSTPSLLTFDPTG